jgi:hypothetical protein
MNDSRVLVILSQGVLAGQLLNEAVAALMVWATYGIGVQIAFGQDAIALLSPPSEGSKMNHFKAVRSLISSFEFYDLPPVWVLDAPVPVDTIVDAQTKRMEHINLQDFKAVIRW